MAEQEEISDPRTESLTDKISDKIHGDGDGDVNSSSSSSSSDSEHEDEKMATESSVKEKIHHALGREKPVHKVFGGGKRTYQPLSACLFCPSSFPVIFWIFAVLWLLFV